MFYARHAHMFFTRLQINCRISPSTVYAIMLHSEMRPRSHHQCDVRVRAQPCIRHLTVFPRRSQVCRVQSVDTPPSCMVTCSTWSDGHYLSNLGWDVLSLLHCNRNACGKRDVHWYLAPPPSPNHFMHGGSGGDTDNFDE